MRLGTEVSADDVADRSINSEDIEQLHSASPPAQIMLSLKDSIYGGGEARRLPSVSNTLGLYYLGTIV